MTDATVTTIDGLGETRPRRKGTSWLVRSTVVLSILFGVTAALGIGMWVMAENRAGEAVEAVVADAHNYRETLKAEAEAAAAKKGKKGKKGKTTAVPASLASLVPEEDVPLATLKEANEELEGKLNEFFPKGTYIVIDTANNRLYLRKGQEVVLDAVCSTGSYSKLDAPDGRSWFFHTPRGQFKVRGKVKKPVWIKPDWAFVEEAEPIPGARHESRYEPYVMGDYALSFGNGYYIHGTLYNRLLGQSVTHGCVRLGDEDLAQVFESSPIGTPIFIY
jgi:L,D-transpeptidase ErfK/SrfK